ELEVKLVEVGLHDPAAGVGKVDGYAVAVGGASKLVGKKVKARVERALDGTAYAQLVDGGVGAETALSAEAEAEKPTRQPRARKAEPGVEPGVEPEAEPQLEPEPEPESESEPEELPEADVPAEEEGRADGGNGAEAAQARKKTRRGSRGGRGRTRKAPTTTEGQLD